VKQTSASPSNIASVGFDMQNHHLEVKFENGGTYQYSNVPTMTYHSLMASRSIGRYFDKHIKDVYPYRKVG
jgi:hypothetical protein